MNPIPLALCIAASQLAQARFSDAPYPPAQPPDAARSATLNDNPAFDRPVAAGNELRGESPPAAPYGNSLEFSPSGTEPRSNGSPTAGAVPRRDPAGAPPAPFSPYGSAALRGSAPSEHAGGDARESGEVAPTAANVAIGQSGPENQDVAQILLQDAMVAPPQLEAEFTPVSLTEVLQSRYDAGSRVLAVTAYWTLVQRIAEYSFALDEQHFLEQIPQPEAPHEYATWLAARAAAEAASRLARLGVLEQQYQLAGQIHRSATARLPWPADAPLTGAYRTRFDTIFAARPQPARLQQIHATLPLQHELLQSQATAVARQMEASDSLLRVLGQRQSTLPQLLDSHHRLMGQRRAFLETVADYNRNIAEYAFAVANQAAPEVLVATLIRRSPLSNTAATTADSKPTLR